MKTSIGHKKTCKFIKMEQHTIPIFSGTLIACLMIKKHAKHFKCNGYFLRKMRQHVLTMDFINIRLSV